MGILRYFVRYFPNFFPRNLFFFPRDLENVRQNCTNKPLVLHKRAVVSSKPSLNSENLFEKSLHPSLVCRKSEPFSPLDFNRESQENSQIMLYQQRQSGNQLYAGVCYASPYHFSPVHSIHIRRDALLYSFNFLLHG